MNLSELRNGETGIIVKVKGHGAFRKRLTEMGFIKGKEILVIKNAPLKDPIEYKILDYHISLRRTEAVMVEVITLDHARELVIKDGYDGIIDGEILNKTVFEKGKVINIALVGNPNCGKTTLFNFASGSREHVGNYSGVTIESKLGYYYLDDYTFNIIDLPGTYSLSAYSPEELFVRKHLFGEFPDIVINVIDSSNLERNLFLTTQLIDMDLKAVIALNMYDELEKKGAELNFEDLGKLVGIPIVPTISSKGKGIKELFRKVIDVYENRDPYVRHIHVNYGRIIENSIKRIQSFIKNNDVLKENVSPRFFSIKLLEKDESILGSLNSSHEAKELTNLTLTEISIIEAELSEDSETAITDAKYGFIAGALKETYKEGAIKRRRKTEIIDTFLTHRVFGFPIFLLFMFLMFFTTFQIGKYPMELIDSFVEYSGYFVNKFMAEGPLKDLLVDGIISGVGGVIVFLPNILILFLFISFMEDTGYMSRAAFIMDKLMHKIGLHGKSFIPLIMGFGCNVPAIMSTRTIENKSDRLLTILINPFISCSARLPVYILFIGAFFPDNPSSMLFLIYFIGIVIAIFMAKLFKKTLFKTSEVPFVMELPPYRMPTFKSTFLHMWDKGYQYLRKMGGIILIASILIWALGYFPRYSPTSEALTNELILKTENLKLAVEQNVNSDEINNLSNDIRRLNLNIEQIRQENSYVGRIGKFIEPVMMPLGFDWKTSISLLAGITAKEIVISTLAVLYQVDSNQDNLTESLKSKLINETYLSGQHKGKMVFTPLTVFGLLMFILIYFPCVAVIVAIKRESGSWKWAVFTIFYTTTLAWVVAFLINKIGILFI